MELNEYQLQANQTDQQPETGIVDSDSNSILVPLLGLSGEVGELLSEYKKRLRDGDSYTLFIDRIKEELGDLLWYLSNVATKSNLTLEDIATYNLNKTTNRWQPFTGAGGSRKLYDDCFPPSERLPRQMEVSINERGSKNVQLFIDGIHTGDTLTDNRCTDDGYRFHDIFHLSYASVLGWSPSLRALLKKKRKSNPTVDEVEDGGRARVIEEGITAMVFSYAERRNFLEGAEGVNYELLRTIKDMSGHLEVGSRTEGEWERAIMIGFQLWRQIRVTGKGRLRADLNKGTIELVV